MRVVYFSITGQTRFFIKKLNLEQEPVEITENYPDIEMDEPFILLVPTYAEEFPDGKRSQDIMDPVFEFMETDNNAKLCKGVIGSGNRNFGPLYIITAHEISEKYNVPILYDYEMNGTPVDVQYVKALIDTTK